MTANLNSLEWHDLLDDAWTESANDSRAWAHSASKLAAAGEQLQRVSYRIHPPTGNYEPFSELVGPMLMLYGMAIECLLKAVAAKNGFRFAEDGSKNMKQLGKGNHALVELAQRPEVDIELSTDERDLCERLTHSVRFAGRYPTAMRRAEGRSEDGWTDVGVKLKDPKTLRELIGRLFDSLPVVRGRDGIVLIDGGDYVHPSQAHYYQGLSSTDL